MTEVVGNIEAYAKDPTAAKPFIPALSPMPFLLMPNSESLLAFNAKSLDAITSSWFSITMAR